MIINGFHGTIAQSLKPWRKPLINNEGVLMSRLLVCLPAERLSESQLAQIQAAAPNMRVVMMTERAEIERVLDNVEIAVGGFPHDLLPRARSLRWLQEWGAGVDWLLRHPEF